MTLFLVGADAERLADSIEATAMRDFYRIAPSLFGARSSYIGGATVLLAPKLPFTFFNRVIGLGSATPAEASDIDDIMAVYGTSHVDSFWIHVGPAAQPPRLSDQLTERRFTLATRQSWAKFLRGVEPSQARDTRLTPRKATAEDAPAVGTVVCAAYGLPLDLGPWFAALVGRSGWHVWIVERDEQIVATGALFVQGKTAWMGVGATLSQHRGLGAQSSLINARIDQARELACRIIATETGEPMESEPSPSLVNIRRAGFTQISSRLNYVSPELGPGFYQGLRRGQESLRKL